MSKVQQKYKGEKKRLKLSLAETIAPAQGTELLTLLSSSESDGEDDNDEMDEIVKMYQASDSLNRFSPFISDCYLLIDWGLIVHWPIDCFRGIMNI